MKNDFKVVKIVDDKTIVINAGKNNGIQNADKFEIYELGDEVIDPETNENLGNLTSHKAYVQVINVYEKMALCENTERETLLLSANYSSIKPLNIDISQITGGISKNKTIRIGDRAKLLNKTKNTD